MEEFAPKCVAGLHHSQNSDDRHIRTFPLLIVKRERRPPAAKPRRARRLAPPSFTGRKAHLAPQSGSLVRRQQAQRTQSQNVREGRFQSTVTPSHTETGSNRLPSAHRALRTSLLSRNPSCEFIKAYSIILMLSLGLPKQRYRLHSDFTNRLMCCRLDDGLLDEMRRLEFIYVSCHMFCSLILSDSRDAKLVALRSGCVRHDDPSRVTRKQKLPRRSAGVSQPLGHWSSKKNVVRPVFFLSRSPRNSPTAR